MQNVGWWWRRVSHLSIPSVSCILIYEDLGPYMPGFVERNPCVNEVQTQPPSDQRKEANIHQENEADPTEVSEDQQCHLD